MANGVELTLYSESTPQASLTGITACWWDVTDPFDFSHPVGRTDSASTDANGVLKLDLSDVSGLSIGGTGYLLLRKEDGADHRDSLVFQSKITTSDVTGGTLLEYVADWGRPSEWPAIDSPETGVQKIQGILKVIDVEDLGNQVKFSVTGAYTVDWGDGSASEDFSSGATAAHTYSYSDTDLTNTSYGYKCAVVTITPQSGQNLTACNFYYLTPYNTNSTTNWLDMMVNSQYMTSASFRQAKLLERCVIGECSFTSTSYMFHTCSSLQSISLFDISSANTTSYMLYNCVSLKSVPLFDLSSVLDATYMLNGCYSLRSVPLLNLSSVTATNYMLNYCYSLQSLPLFDMSSVTDASNMISYCYSLRYGKLSGTKASISYQGCSLGPAALNAIFDGLATVAGQTITVTGNYGISETGYDPSIATDKGWMVTD